MSGVAIITELCLDVKDRACVDVCPVQCIDEFDPEDKVLRDHTFFIRHNGDVLAD